MGSRAEEMIKVAMDSFASRNAAEAESLVELDELIDRANRQDKRRRAAGLFGFSNNCEYGLCHVGGHLLLVALGHGGHACIWAAA